MKPSPEELNILGLNALSISPPSSQSKAAQKNGIFSVTNNKNQVNITRMDWEPTPEPPEEKQPMVKFGPQRLPMNVSAPLPMAINNDSLGAGE